MATDSDPAGELGVDLGIDVNQPSLDKFLDPPHSGFGKGRPGAMNTRDHVVSQLRETLVKRPAVLEEQSVWPLQDSAGIKG